MKCQLIKLPTDSITNKITFENIFEFDTAYNQKKLFKLVNVWFNSDVSKFNRGNNSNKAEVGEALIGTGSRKVSSPDVMFKITNPVQLNDPEEFKIIGKVCIQFKGRLMGCGRLFFVNYDLIVKTKNHKIKIIATNFSYNHFSLSNNNPEAIFGNEEFCKQKGTFEQLYKCDWCENGINNLFNFIKIDVVKLIDEIQPSIIKNNLSDKSDW